MGELVNLHDQPARHEDDELVENLARYADGTLSMAAVKARHRLTDAEWAKLGEDDELVRRISDRKLQRIRGGQTKRERAQIEVADAPPILGKLMRSPDSNARHVIDSCKVLNDLAQPTGGESAGAGTLFQITINLTGDSDTPHVLHFEKPIAIDPNPNNTDTPQEEWLPVIAASKKEDSGGGQGHL